MYLFSGSNAILRYKLPSQATRDTCSKHNPDAMESKNDINQPKNVSIDFINIYS